MRQGVSEAKRDALRKNELKELADLLGMTTQQLKDELEEETFGEGLGSVGRRIKEMKTTKKLKKPKAEKPVQMDKTPKVEEDNAELLDFANLRAYTIDDIHILGRLLGNIDPLLNNCMTKFHNALSKETHRQCLDMFRDGITIAELRQKSFKLHTQYRDDPVTVSYQMLVYRLAKAIYNFGTKAEKEAFNF